MKQCLAVVGGEAGEAGVEMLNVGTGSFPHFPVIFRRAFLSMGAKAVCKSRLNSLVFEGGLKLEQPGFLEIRVCEH